MPIRSFAIADRPAARIGDESPASLEVILDEAADQVQPTASIGKLLLLIETSRQIAAGTLDPAQPLTRATEDQVADSGVWHTLCVDTLPVADVAALIGATSDNLATNVLLRRVTLAAVDSTRERLGLRTTRLLDRVRDRRTPDLPPTLSTGAAGELAGLMARIARAAGVGFVDGPATPQPDLVGAATLLDWLAGNTDLSLAADAFGLDPLAHRVGDGPVLLLANKTGADDGIRADVGLVWTAHRAFAYAVLATFGPGELPVTIEGMRARGEAIRRAALAGDQPPGQPIEHAPVLTADDDEPA